MKRLGKYNYIYLIAVISLLLAGVLAFGCSSGSSTDNGNEDELYILKFNSSQIAGVGQRGDVDISVEKAKGLVGGHLTVSFNPSVVEIISVSTSGAGFIFTDAGTIATFSERILDKENGKLTLTFSTPTGFTGALSDGKIATITFKALSAGNSPLSFIDVQPTDVYLNKYSASGAVETPLLLNAGSVSVGSGEDFVLDFNPYALEIAGAGQSGTADVVVTNASGLITAKFKVSFNPSVVEVTSIKTSGTGFIFTDAGVNVNVIENTYDNSSGNLVIGVGGLKQGFTGANGTGKLATITFKGKTTGVSELGFINTASDDLLLSKAANNNLGWVEQPVKTYKGIIAVK
jgi:hypothetical protein